MQHESMEELAVLIPILRALIYMTPDSKTVDPIVDPAAGWDINVWESDGPKTAAIQVLEALFANLSNSTPEQAASSLEVVKSAVERSLENDMAREGITSELQRLIDALR